MTFVESPGIELRNRGFSHFGQSEIHRVVGALQNGRESHIEGISLLFEQFAGGFGFGNAIFRKLDIRPTREEVFEIPFALAMANQD